MKLSTPHIIEGVVTGLIVAALMYWLTRPKLQGSVSILDPTTGQWIKASG